jgi:type IV pilus assembly protein PilB
VLWILFKALGGPGILKIKTDELKQLLIENNLATEKKLLEVEKTADDQHASFQDLLISKKIVSEKDLVKLYGQIYKIPFVDLSTVEIQKDVISRLPEKVARRYQAVVFAINEDDSVNLAMSDPMDIQAVQFIEKEVGFSTKVFIATTSDILQALDLYKEGLSSEISKVIEESEEEISIDSNELAEDKINSQNVQEIVQEAPIARALNIILEYAVKSRASDIHIEPREAFIQIRYRVDGILLDTMSLPTSILSSLTTRIKILANLRIDEHRIPQDGRIKIKVGSQVVSIRVSTLPIVDGEKVVMRLLDESGKPPTLEELGFSGTALWGIKSSLAKPHGMLLVTGPTGSGKSTTLYSALSMLNSIEVNISTVEDPIEYRMPGVNQTQVNTKTGMTFASGLRALLRQDPDIIMVGEVRDKETAEMAVHAALTGHVVLSTLHTNNAAGCLPRLLDMEVEPFLISSTVNAVIGQRLVRKLCPDCRAPYQVPPEQIEEVIKEFDLDPNFLFTTPSKELAKVVAESVTQSKDAGVGGEHTIPAPPGLTDKESILDQIAKDPDIINRTLGQAEESQKSLREKIFLVNDTAKKESHSGHNLSLTLFRGVGCRKCGNTGYKGRLGIYEVLEVSDKIQAAIINHESTDSLQKISVEEGMITMGQDGFIKALIGVTTIEEVLRVTRE